VPVETEKEIGGENVDVYKVEKIAPKKKDISGPRCL